MRGTGSRPLSASSGSTPSCSVASGGGFVDLPERTVRHLENAADNASAQADAIRKAMEGVKALSDGASEGATGE